MMRFMQLCMCSAALLLSRSSASNAVDLWEDASLAAEEPPHTRALSGGGSSLGSGSLGSGVAGDEQCDPSATLNVTHGPHRTLQYNLTTAGPFASLTDATLCCDRHWHKATDAHLEDIVQAYVHNGTLPDHGCTPWMQDSVLLASGRVEGTECARGENDTGAASQAEQNGTCPFALAGTDACLPAPWTAGTISSVPFFAKQCVVLVRALTGQCISGTFCAARAGVAVRAKKKGSSTWYAHPELAVALVFVLCLWICHACRHADRTPDSTDDSVPDEPTVQPGPPCRKSGVVSLGRRRRCT